MFAFQNMSDFGVSLKSNERSMVLSLEHKFGGRVFLVPCDANYLNCLEMIIIQLDQPYVHEVIYNLPIKLFLDIEEEEFTTINQYTKKKNEILLQIAHFKAEYDEHLMFLFDELVQKKWILLDASSPQEKKVSFHLIANHETKNGFTFFKSVYHLKGYLKSFLKNKPLGRYVDNSFSSKKSLRTYYSCHRKDKQNKFRRLNVFGDPDAQYSNETMKWSLLQNYDFKNSYVELKIGDCYLQKNPGIKKIVSSNKSKCFISSKGSVPQCQLFVNELVRYLRNRLREVWCKFYKRTFEFSFLKDNSFTIYRVKRDAGQIQNVVIDLYGPQNTNNCCIIQKCRHKSRTGRVIRLLGTNSSVVQLGCFSVGRLNHVGRLDIKIPQRERKLLNMIKDIKNG